MKIIKGAVVLCIATMQAMDRGLPEVSLTTSAIFTDTTSLVLHESAFRNYILIESSLYGCDIETHACSQVSIRWKPFNKDTPLQDSPAEIDCLFTRENARRKKYATQLINYCFEYLHQKKCKEVFCLVDLRKTPAVKFLKAHGFTCCDKAGRARLNCEKYLEQLSKNIDYISRKHSLSDDERDFAFQTKFVKIFLSKVRSPKK